MAIVVATWVGPNGDSSSPGSGKFSTASYWSTGATPDSSVNTVLPDVIAAAAYSVTVDSKGTFPAIRNLIVGTNATVDATSSFSVSALTNRGVITAGGVWTLQASGGFDNHGLVTNQHFSSIILKQINSELANSSDGVIQADNGGTNIALFNGATFSNAGLVKAINGGSVVLTYAFDDHGSSLTGGTWMATDRSYIVVTKDDKTPMIELAATLVLSGASSHFFYNRTTPEESLTTIDADGSLEVLAGRDYVATVAIVDNGAIRLGGGSFTAAGLSGDGEISGYGTLDAVVTNLHVIASGGTLELVRSGNIFDGTLDGTGTLILGTGTNRLTALVNAGNLINNAALTVTGGASPIYNTGTLTNDGTLTVVAQVVNSGTITNLKGATLAFGGDYSITTDPAVKAGTFTNAGLVEKTAGGGKSIIRTGSAALTSTGVIDVQIGTLALTGSTVSITGAIKGAGTIEFGVGATTLGDGASVSTANFDIIGTGAHVTVGRILTYANDFSATSNTELTITAGDMLKLTGTASFAHDMVDGAGRLTTTGATTINDVTLGGTAQWYNAGVITETGGTLTVGDNAANKAIFLNQATGVFNLAGNVGIGIGSATTSTFTNQGLLAKTAGGMSTISIAMVNTGTIEAASGTLDLQKAVTGTGLIKIDAGKVLQADAAVSAGQAVDFNGGGDKLVLTDAAHFAAKLQDFGAGDKLDLRQFDPATMTLGFAENAAHTAGTLTVTDGALTAKIALLGQYVASAFHTSSDGVGGTYVTYTPPPAPALIAAPQS